MNNLIQVLQNFGLHLSGQPVLDNTYQRVKFNGSNDLRGWYIGRVDNGQIYCAYGSWDQDQHHKYTSHAGGSTEESSRHFALLAEERKKQQEADQAKAARIASRIMATAAPCPADHPYLVKKGIKPVPGLKLEKKTSALLVPMYDQALCLTSLQRIFPDGAKKMLYHGKKQGCGFIIHGDPEISPCICEGLATGASIHMATGGKVFVAFDVGNMAHVARALVDKYPNLIICADNDHAKENNIGLTKGTKLAAELNVKLSYPKGITGTDFNDLHAEKGLEAVRDAINKVVGSGHIKLPLPTELSPVAPFDYALLPESLNAWVSDICERMQCPPDFVSVGVMTALAAVIGRKIGIRPQTKSDWTVVPNTWGMVVGRPGVLKSPALEAALAPLNRLAAAANNTYKSSIETYKQEMAVAKLRAEAREKKARKELAQNHDADVLSLLAANEETNEPVLKRYKTNDSTPASLGELLRQNANGLLVYRDEIVSLLKGLDREDQAEGRGFYLTGWNGDSPYTFDRIGRGLNLHIEAVCLSVLGGTQPGRLNEYIRQAVEGGAADDGLIQRFGLLVWPDISGPWQNVDRWPDTEAKTQAFKVFDILDRLAPSSIGAQQDTDIDGNPEGIPYLRFDGAALELFLEWRIGLENRLRSGDLHPALESHFAKYRKLVPALSLIIHLAEGRTGPVGEDATLKALAWSEYLETHAIRAYNAVSVPEIASARAILKKIESGELKSPFSSRDVLRPQWSLLNNNETVHSALELLIEHGHLRVTWESTGGRTAKRYHHIEGEVKA
jgi:putative DNA primase/helicase